jgi:hypothetical protein
MASDYGEFLLWGDGLRNLGLGNWDLGFVV